MKLDYLNNNHTKDKKEIVSVGLLGVSAVMVVLIAIKVTGFLAAPARAEKSVKRAVALSKPDANDMEKCLAKSRAIVDELKKKNLFAPPPPKQHPVKEVFGILGDEVLIKDKWYKVGDTIGDANIVAIEPTQVRITWNGTEKVFLPIDAASSSRPGPPKPGGPVAKAEEKGRPEMVQVQQEVRGGEGMGRFSGGDRAAMMERMRAMRERFENMSPEERERAMAEMRERFGGRGPGGGRRGGRGGR